MDINKDFKNGTYGIVSDKSIFINDDKYPHKLATIEDLKTQAAILERYITFNMSTGAITFDGVSGSVGATTYVVGAGKGYIIDNFTDVANPTLTYVEWAASGTISINPPVASQATYLLVDKYGVIHYHSSIPTPEERTQMIYIAHVIHPVGVNVISAIINQVDFIQSPAAQVRNLWAPIRLINDGVTPEKNITNALRLNITHGFLWGNGINFTTPTEPNSNTSKVEIAAVSPTTFHYRTKLGDGSNNNTTIRPNYYDLNGVVTEITPAANKATNQRIYLAPNGQMVIQYGQTIYSTLTEAIQSINLESFTTYVNLQNDAILIGILSIAADTDDLTKWNSSTYTRMLLVSKFGESVGASGGAGSVGTLQQAYDNSTSPHIEINSITDGLTIQDGVDATVKPLMKFKDYAEVERARINSDGTVGFKESAGTDSWKIDATSDFTISQENYTPPPGETKEIIKIYKTDSGDPNYPVKVEINAKTTILELEFGGW